MDDVEKKRQALYRARPTSGTWAKKVRAMPPSQVIAVYLRFQKEGKLK